MSDDRGPSSDSMALEANRLIAQEYQRLKELHAKLLELLGDSIETAEQRDILEDIFKRYLECHHRFRSEVLELIIVPPHG
jgi:hypothetical protein